MIHIKINFKTFIIILISIILITFACTYNYFNNHKKPQNRVSFHSALQKTKEIDKLFTGVYVVPVLDKKYGYIKRDILKEKLNDLKERVGSNHNVVQKPEKVIKGYCKKRFEVYVGYENISELLRNRDIIDNACHGHTDKLPNPKILAVNCKNTEVRGNYEESDMCYSWDINANLRNSIIINQMTEDNIIEKINKRGRESLKTIAMIFCE